MAAKDRKALGAGLSALFGDLSLREIHEQAEKRGIELELLSDYCYRKTPGQMRQVVLNFASLDEENIFLAISLLEDIFLRETPGDAGKTASR